MAREIQTLDILHDYLSGVMLRANDHGPGVNEIALAIAGGIMWRNTDKIFVFTKSGEMKNVLWLTVEDRTLCFTYNHLTGNIDVKEGSQKGIVVRSFNNQTPLRDVKNFFESLQ